MDLLVLSAKFFKKKKDLDYCACEVNCTFFNRNPCRTFWVTITLELRKWFLHGWLSEFKDLSKKPFSCISHGLQTCVHGGFCPLVSMF